MSLIDTYTLNNGVEIPVIGFGTWQTPDGEVAENSVSWALEAGYRHIDTAAVYKNEESVGRAIKNSDVAREDIFVTTKLWNDSHSYDKAKAALDESLKKLQLDYIDLYLIHWPSPKNHDNFEKEITETWHAMEEAVEAGKIRAIGVSNFMPHHLKPILNSAKIKPAVNQIFLNPSDMQAEVVEFNTKQGIVNEAYSPFGTGKIFEVEELNELAEKYDKTVGQLVLKWSLQHNFLPLPKTVHEERVYENKDVFDFTIEEEDMNTIDGLHGKAGKAPNPDR